MAEGRDRQPERVWGVPRGYVVAAILGVVAVVAFVVSLLMSSEGLRSYAVTLALIAVVSAFFYPWADKKRSSG